ncbi:MAG: hypothetical protein M3Z66_17915 [Chloroflexota bacterium]|nr:hypothetical protein [Chloroflexota bacterium]
MDCKQDELSDELKALLAASRELSAEYDDALADLFLEQLRSREMLETRCPPTLAGASTARNHRVPIAIAVGTGTFLSIVAVLMSGASIDEFLLGWIFTTLVMAAVVQIGLIIEKSQRATDGLVR